jgi:5-methylcytosine-specific restriction protein A
MFIAGERYRRRDLHEKYGGEQQGGISTPSRAPLIMLITGEAGEQHGYVDGPQPDGAFWYTGEGQVGDMAMVRGNRAVAEHRQLGKALHLFDDEGAGTLRAVSRPCSERPSGGGVRSARNGKL